MCRYSRWGMDYNMPYACFNCRKSFKISSVWENYEEKDYSGQKCPECGDMMTRMGHDFQAPRKQNKNQWRKLRLLVAAGITFNSCGCEGPGYRPQTLSEAKNRIKLPTEEENFRDDAEFGRRGYEYRQRRPIGRYV
jgi:DNA-directed RNA polymerase subunit RPC12/RpoP